MVRLRGGPFPPIGLSWRAVGALEERLVGTVPGQSVPEKPGRMRLWTGVTWNGRWECLGPAEGSALPGPRVCPKARVHWDPMPLPGHQLWGWQGRGARPCLGTGPSSLGASSNKDNLGHRNPIEFFALWLIILPSGKWSVPQILSWAIRSTRPGRVSSGSSGSGGGRREPPWPEGCHSSSMGRCGAGASASSSLPSPASPSRAFLGGALQAQV